jgi:hypothetical protein
MDATSPPPRIDRNSGSPSGTQNGQEPSPTHTAYAFSRSPDEPPERVLLGPITLLDNGHIMGRFPSVPTGHWGWRWYAVPIGEMPPPLPQERSPKGPAQQSRPAPERPAEPQPLPGEEDEPQGFFGGGGEPR